VLLIATGVSNFGCGDSATVNPVVELSRLSVTPGTLQPGFSGENTQYRVNLTSDTTTVTVTAQPAVAGDTVTIDGQATTSQAITLDPPGETTVVEIVVSESTTSSRTYTVRLVRADRAGNNSLENLAVSPGTPPLVFNENTLNYSVTVGNTVNSVTVTPTLQDPLATMTVNDLATISGQASTITLNPAGQSTTITILVKAQNGTEKPYTITVSRGVSNNNNLRNLTISPGTLNFSAGTTDYTVNLPATLASSVTNVRVTPTLDDATTATITVNGQAATSGQAQPTPLPQPGSSTFINIVVTAQDRTQKTYTVNVTRTALGGNNNLRSLTVSQPGLSPTFRADRTAYTLNVGAGIGSINVTAAPEDSNATLTVTSNGQVTTSGQTRTITLRDAGLSTTITIRVTAQNGSQKPYTITVDRAAPPPPSGNNNLSALTVRLSTSSPNLISFSPNTTIYTVDVGNGVASIRVTPTLDDPAATLTVTSNGPGPITTSGQTRTITLRDAGLSTTITIQVTAKNGSQKPYTIIVDRAAPPPPSGNNNLQNLTVSLGTLSPSFSTTRARTDYAVNDVSSSATAIAVTATPQDPNATVEINQQAGNSRSIPLPTGPSSTEIEVRVIAPNGTDKTYTITVTQPAPAAPPPAPASAPDLITEDDSCPLLEPPDPNNPDPDGCVPGTSTTPGTSRSDNITNVTTPRFRVPQPGPGQTPNLYVDGKKVDSRFDAANNTLQPTAPLSGDNNGVQHLITSTVTDTATTLESAQSDPLIVTISTGQSGV